MLLSRLAFKKEKVDGIVIADDTGLFVEHLNGQPEYIQQDLLVKMLPMKITTKIIKTIRGVPYEKEKLILRQ